MSEFALRCQFMIELPTTKSVKFELEISKVSDKVQLYLYCNFSKPQFSNGLGEKLTLACFLKMRGNSDQHLVWVISSQDREHLEFKIYFLLKGAQLQFALISLPLGIANHCKKIFWRRKFSFSHDGKDLTLKSPERGPGRPLLNASLFKNHTHVHSLLSPTPKLTILSRCLNSFHLRCAGFTSSSLSHRDITPTAADP